MKTAPCRYALPLLLLALFAPPLTATRRDEKAEAILKRAEASLDRMQTLTADVVGTVIDSRPNRLPTVRYKARLRLKRPNFARVEIEETVLRTRYENPTPETARTEIVSTGKTLWKYDAGENTYVRREADPEGKGIDGMADALPVGMPLYMFFNARVPHAEIPAVYAGTETWGGIPLEVVEFTSEEKPAKIRQRLSFGPDGLLRRVTNSQLAGQYLVEWSLENIRVNPPLAASEFAYAPPVTAKDATRPAPELLPVGTDAPDFTVSDIRGKPVRLSDYRGKVVVLDFWSVGCGHSVESREQLNALARKMGKGVVFLSVHVWDTKEAFGEWLPKRPRYDALTFALDAAPVGKDIATTLYRVPGLPTLYVIGKDGKVAAAFLGYGGTTSAWEKAVAAAR